MMGGGGGSLANMNLTIKQNLAMRKKKSYFRMMKTEIHRSGRGGSKSPLKELTEEERNQIKARVRKQLIKDRIANVIYAILTVAIMAGLYYYFFHFLT